VLLGMFELDSDILYDSKCYPVKRLRAICVS
jgi:hypothetical protein